MTNQEFELICKQSLEIKNSEVTKLIGTILNKEGKELDKSISQHAILSYILPELLNYGCIVRTTTNEIAKACNCKSTVVNNVLGFVGFKYERDRVTHKLGYESKGLFERYYQYEYTDNGATKKTSSVFNIVATQKLFDLLRDELGLEIKINEEELAKLHADSKAKAYTKSVKRETLTVTFTKEITVFSNAEGTTNTVQYSGIEEAIEQLQEIKAEQEEAIEELSFEDEEEELELEMTDEEKAEDIINKIKSGEINDSNRTEYKEEAKLLDKVNGLGCFNTLMAQAKRSKRNARVSKPVTVETDDVYDVDDNDEPTTFNVKPVAHNRTKNTVNKPVVINDEWEEQIEDIEDIDYAI